MRRRVEIARGLIHEPKIFFLDEPTTGLDPQSRRQLWRLLETFRSAGGTVLLTTHYMDEAEILCDRVAIVDHGRLLQLDSPGTLVRGLDAQTRITVAPGQLTVDEARALRGVDDVDVDSAGVTLRTREPASVLTALADQQRLAGISVQTGTLEDVFLSLTGREYRA
jgi:ABC-2 type transport system ATP-binding protein